MGRGAGEGRTGEDVSRWRARDMATAAEKAAIIQIRGRPKNNLKLMALAPISRLSSVSLRIVWIGFYYYHQCVFPPPRFRSSSFFTTAWPCLLSASL